MNIAQQLTALNNAKQDIKAAIIEKGQTVGDNMNDYAEAIGNISGGEVDDTDYLCFEAIEDSAVSMSIYGTPISANFEYSTDKSTWTTWDYSNIDIQAGTKLYVRGDNPNGIVKNTTFTDYITFNGTGKMNLSGNFMTLFDPTGAMSECPLDRTFFVTFQGNTALYDCGNAYFPMDVLPDRCLHSTFKNCTGMIRCPEILATTVSGQFGINQTFSGCTSLKYANSIMPKYLNASSAIQAAFNGCTNLITSPYLPAVTLTSSAYNNLFNGCASLQYIKADFTTTPSGTYCAAWVTGIASTGCFIKAKNATWTTTGTSACPSGWTLITSVS